MIGGLGNDEKGVDVNGQHGGEGERTATEKPKMGIIEYEPSGIRRYGLDNLHLGHPVLGAILWSGLADPSWEGSLSELLDILNDNVEDRVKELPEWPSSPEALYMCLWVYLWEREGYLFSLFGGDIWVQAIWDERPEMSKVLIELVLPDEFGNDEQDDEGEHYAGFQFDFDWIDSDEREEG